MLCFCLTQTLASQTCLLPTKQMLFFLFGTHCNRGFYERETYQLSGPNVYVVCLLVMALQPPNAFVIQCLRRTCVNLFLRWLVNGTTPGQLHIPLLSKAFRTQESAKEARHIVAEQRGCTFERWLMKFCTHVVQVCHHPLAVMALRAACHTLTCGAGLQRFHISAFQKVLSPIATYGS